jgi:hypothetical protein
MMTFGALIEALPGAGQPGTASVGARASMKGAACPSAVATLRGHAVKSIGGPLRNIFVRVREARFGRIVDSALTNHVGAYAAKGLELGNHIVEIGGLHQTPLATTSLISVNAGAG